LKIHRLPALETNIFYLLEEDGKALIFDPGDADVLQSFLKEHNLKPEAIWLTHHHWDHINGVEQLKSHYDIPVYSSVFDSKRLSFVDHGLKAGSEISFHSNSFKIIDFKGHAKGQIGYHCEKSRVIFVGDLLFSLGCGRLLEGTAEDHFESLNRLKKLPRDTKIYFAHEYTQTNFEFLKTIAEQVPPEDSLEQIQAHILWLKRDQEFTSPSTLDFELRNNPFLRCSFQDFVEIRKLRDLW
tara:strand:- start:1315 stop:2034 length:720 start_codon:yes stop_codon:yes gene_type:complete